MNKQTIAIYDITYSEALGDINQTSWNGDTITFIKFTPSAMPPLPPNNLPGKPMFFLPAYYRAIYKDGGRKSVYTCSPTSTGEFDNFRCIEGADEVTVQLSFDHDKRDENGNLFLSLTMDEGDIGQGDHIRSPVIARGYAKKRIVDLTNYKEEDEVGYYEGFKARMDDLDKEGKGYTFLGEAELQQLQN